MLKITEENYLKSYELGNKVYLSNMTRKDAIEVLSESGMNFQSATYYINGITNMLNGTRYTSTINEPATIYFLTHIESDYGKDRLKLALDSLKSHLDYQKDKNVLKSLWDVYYTFLKRMK